MDVATPVIHALLLRQQTGEKSVVKESSKVSQVDPNRLKTRTQQVPRAEPASQ